MFRRNKERQQPRLPTAKEFLQYKPRRLDFEWSEKADGLVELKVPKFRSNFGKSFCKVIKKDNMFTANLDGIGSLVWKNCDGNNTVEQILEIMKKKISEQKNIDQRLFLFLQQMKGLNYIDF